MENTESFFLDEASLMSIFSLLARDTSSDPRSQMPIPFQFNPLNKFLLGTFGDTGYTEVNGLREEVIDLSEFFLEML